MQRSKLKNIINKSKARLLTIGESPFDKFKKTLPEGLVKDEYRLEAAWKAYGKPGDFNKALWEGMIQPIDEDTYKLPSIGYNEETDEYEYLNKGKDNETVAKDIRVWDNDVIPFVQELKHGGYVRIFNEEKDCWTYTKNLQKRAEPSENQDGQVIDSFLKGGKKENNNLVIPSFLTLDENGNYISKYYSDDDEAEDLKWYRSKDSKDFRKQFRLNDLEWENGTPDGKPFMYIPKKKYNELFFKLNGRGFGGGGNGTISLPNGYTYLPEDGVFARPIGQDVDGKNLYETDDGNVYVYKLGGQMNVIPEGALHARKNNMDLAKEGEVTHKGIPVIDNDGEQVAEIEKEEIIFCKRVTDKIELAYKKFNSDESSLKDKDELAILIGKFLTKEILENTDDKTGLIELVLEKTI